MRFKHSMKAGGLLLVLVFPMTAAAATCPGNIAQDAPNSRYNTGTDGVVTDTQTGLMWMKCSVGYASDGAGLGCADDGVAATATTYSWTQALAVVDVVNSDPDGRGQGHDDWRLPNRNELASLVERSCHSPAINEAAFPDTPNSSYWSASPDQSDVTRAWFVEFQHGNVAVLPKSWARYVRLVRAGN